ncbi:MAG: hypothetical protein K1X29_07425 [Bdellovibrionales bacterium]|nr:hypothetical protein [Bdellovibrionales bacterium]
MSEFKKMRNPGIHTKSIDLTTNEYQPDSGDWRVSSPRISSNCFNTFEIKKTLSPPTESRKSFKNQSNNTTSAFAVVSSVEVLEAEGSGYQKELYYELSGDRSNKATPGVATYEMRCQYDGTTIEIIQKIPVPPGKTLRCVPTYSDPQAETKKIPPDTGGSKIATTRRGEYTTFSYDEVCLPEKTSTPIGISCDEGLGSDASSP